MLLTPRQARAVVGRGGGAWAQEESKSERMVAGDAKALPVGPL